MIDASLSAPMTGDELRDLRARSGLWRTYFCKITGINPNWLADYERGTRTITPEIAVQARILDGQGVKAQKISVATFGDKFVVLQHSLLEQIGRWQVDVLPIEHATRFSAAIAARDYAQLHGCEYVPVGVLDPASHDT